MPDKNTTTVWVNFQPKFSEIEPPAESAFSRLAKGNYCVLASGCINSDLFDGSRLMGFLCGECNRSVRCKRYLKQYPGVSLFACACTVAAIRRPFGLLHRWHWEALVNSRLAMPFAEGTVILGQYDPQEYS